MNNKCFFLFLIFVICLQINNSVIDLNDKNDIDLQKNEQIKSNQNLLDLSLKPNQSQGPLPRKLQLPGGGSGAGMMPIVAPSQLPGIINADIYVHNTQSASQFPQMTSPPISMNLNVNGLEKYYSKIPTKFIHLPNPHQFGHGPNLK